MRYNGIIVVLGILILVMSGCKPQTPRQYIQDKKMGEILYDYHLGDAISHDVAGGNNHWDEYQEFVLNKHHVTKDDFDKSMDYYFRHPEKLHDIYENIAKRLSREAERQGVAVSDMNDFGTVSHSNDTSNVWKESSALLLAQHKPFNLHSFAISCDTSFYKGDRIMFSFDTNFMVQDGSRDAVAVIAVKYGNDSIASNMIRIYSSSHYNLNIDDNHHEGMKEIKGFLLMNSENQTPQTTLHLLGLQNIRLFRIHESKKEDSTVNTEQTLN